METDDAQRVLPFQLQFDKPVASQVTSTALQLLLFLLFSVCKFTCCCGCLCFNANSGTVYILGSNFDWQVKIAEWNPEKDLLAMVTEDSKVLLHRFNWQRLWTIAPGTALSLIYASTELFLFFFVFLPKMTFFLLFPNSSLLLLILFYLLLLLEKGKQCIISRSLKLQSYVVISLVLFRFLMLRSSCFL